MLVAMHLGWVTIAFFMLGGVALVGALASRPIAPRSLQPPRNPPAPEPKPPEPPPSATGVQQGPPVSILPRFFENLIVTAQAKAQAARDRAEVEQAAAALDRALVEQAIIAGREDRLRRIEQAVDTVESKSDEEP